MRSIPVYAINMNGQKEKIVFPSIRAAARHVGTGEGPRKTISSAARDRDGRLLQGRNGQWFMIGW